MWKYDFMLISKDTEKALENLGETSIEKDRINKSAPRPPTDSNYDRQLWRFKLVDKDYLMIISKKTEKALDSWGDNQEVGGYHPHTPEEKDYPRHLWRIKPADTKYFKLICKEGSKALDSWGKADKVGKYDEHEQGHPDYDHQLWRLESKGAGYDTPELLMQALLMDQALYAQKPEDPLYFMIYTKLGGTTLDSVDKDKSVFKSAPCKPEDPRYNLLLWTFKIINNFDFMIISKDSGKALQSWRFETVVYKFPPSKPEDEEYTRYLWRIQPEEKPSAPKHFMVVCKNDSRVMDSRYDKFLISTNYAVAPTDPHYNDQLWELHPVDRLAEVVSPEMAMSRLLSYQQAYIPDKPLFFRIISKESGKALQPRVDNNKICKYAPLDLKDPLYQTQQWKFKIIDNSLSIVSLTCGGTMESWDTEADIKYGSSYSMIEPYNRKLWKLNPIDNQYFTLASMDGGKLLDSGDAGNDNVGKSYPDIPMKPSDRQLWRLELIDDHPFVTSQTALTLLLNQMESAKK